MNKKWIKLMVGCLSVLFLVAPLRVNAQAVELAKQKVGDVFETDGGKFEVIKKTDIKETKESGPFKIKVNYIAALTLEPEKQLKSLVEVNENGLANLIAVHVTVENTSDDTLSIYPDQSVLIANKKQLNANFFMSASVGGDFYGNVEKEGLVIFEYDGEIKDVEDMKMIINAPHGESYNSIGEDIVIEFNFDEDAEGEDSTSDAE